MAEPPSTLPEVLEAQAKEIGDKPFLYFEDRTISFAELNRQANSAANGLAALGVKVGVGVSIMMPNSPEWIVVYCATQKLSSYVVPVNIALKGEGLRHVIDHSDSSILVCHPDHLETIQAIEGSLTKLQKIVVNDTETPEGWEPPEGWLALSRLMDASDENPAVEVDPEAISALMYTSGTTGAPKGVVNRYKSGNMGAIRLLGALMQPDEVAYTCLPLFHANALFLSTVRSLVLGLPLALSRRFSASRFWDEIRRYDVTTFNALGAMIPILIKQPERENDRDNKVRVVFSAACPASVWAEFEERFGLHLVEAYAAVDGGGFMVMNLGNGPRGSFGKPTNPIRIVDDTKATTCLSASRESCSSRWTTCSAARSSTTRTRRRAARRSRTAGSTRAISSMQTRKATSTSSIARPTPCAAAARTSLPGRSSARSTLTPPCSSPPCSGCPRSSASTM
jgi:crotonobetaine/carnitine-CoA ligase